MIFRGAILILVFCAAAMAQQITAFPGATTPLTGGEIIYLVQNGTSKQTPVASLTGVAKLSGYTVSTLPACGSATKGNMAYVTDALSPTYNGALTGGSSGVVPVFCSGVAWSSH